METSPPPRLLPSTRKAALPRPPRLRHRLEVLTPEERREVLDNLPADVIQALLYDWEGLHARDNQLAPLWTWFVWLILAGRGYGKTRTGAQTTNEWAKTNPRIALVAATAADARDTMVEGESGILATAPPWFRPKYEPSKRRLTWPNGTIGLLFSADEPERLRGPQFFKAWADELCAWPEPTEGKEGKKVSAWDMLLMCLRLGDNPQAIITTTPKPTPLILQLVKDAARVHVTTGSTFENAANLAPQYLANMRKLYEGTRLGRQELYAEVLTDVPGALFQREITNSTRVETAPALQRVIVSVDPAPTSHSGSDETGIIVLGLGFDDHIYVLADCSLRATPEEWARVAIRAYHDWQADRIIAETNNGGDAVEMVLRTIDPNISYTGVLARRGKYKRAEPVGALHEQKKIHVVGQFEKLENQMAIFTGVNGIRDDRVDAMCHGVHELSLKSGFAFF